MPWFRGYVNKTKGNEHARVIDVELDLDHEDIAAATVEIKKLVAKGETLEQVVGITAP